MLDKYRQNRIHLFGDILSQIESINPNSFNVRNIKDETEKEYNNFDISLKLQSAPMYLSCPEEFGFRIMSSSEIKTYFKEYLDSFPSPSLYYVNDSEVFCVDNGAEFNILYKDKLSPNISFIHEFQDVYFEMVGKEVEFKRNPVSTWISE